MRFSKTILRHAVVALALAFAYVGTLAPVLAPSIVYAQLAQTGAGQSTPAWVLRADGVPATVDLDWANGLYWAGATLADPTTQISVSRASNGYAQNLDGTLTNFGNNVARIGVGTGLLVEEARTNLSTYSHGTGPSANWLITNGAVTDNVTIAPDGTNSALSISANSTLSQHGIGPSNVSFTNALVYAASAYVKQGTGSLIQMSLALAAFSGAGYINLDTATCTIVGSGGTLVASGSFALANGWCRFYIVATASATAASNVFFSNILTSGATRNPSFNGDSTTRFLWCVQVELGSFPTSCIPTTTVAVTRAGDNVTTTGALQTLLNAQERSIVMAAAPLPTAGGGQQFLSFSTTNANAPIRLVSSAVTSVRAGGASVASATLGSGSFSTTSTKVGVSWGTGGVSDVANNGTTAIDAANIVPNVASNLGSINGASNFVNTYIQRLSAWNSRISDTALKGLTVP